MRIGWVKSLAGVYRAARTSPIARGFSRSGGSARLPDAQIGVRRATERDAGDLRQGTQSKRDSPVARTGIHVQQRIPNLMTAHRVLEEGRREAPADAGQR